MYASTDQRKARAGPGPRRAALPRAPPLPAADRAQERRQRRATPRRPSRRPSPPSSTHFDPSGGAPPLAWLTLTLKRECWANAAASISTARRPDRQSHPGAARSPTRRRPRARRIERAEGVSEARATARRAEARRAPRAGPDRRRLQLPRGRRDHRLDLHENQPLRQRGPGRTAEETTCRVKARGAAASCPSSDGPLFETSAALLLPRESERLLRRARDARSDDFGEQGQNAVVGQRSRMSPEPYR